MAVTFLTNEDKAELEAKIAAAGGSSNSGQNVDLTGYAKEQWVQEGFQPKGDYLASTELTNAVNTALAQAKESGEFDGEDGTSVTITKVTESTADGGSNVVTFSDGKTLTVKNGKTGAAGKTAYQYAQDGGYTGTEDEFAGKLANEIVEFAKAEFSELTTDELTQRYVDGTRIVIVNDEYENFVPNAISANGGVYYGCGYQNGVWLNSDGAIETSRQSCITGFIPYSNGSVITIKGSKGKPEQSGQYVATYDGSFALIGIIAIQALISATNGTYTTDEKNLYEFVIDTSAYTATTMFDNAAYIRISLNPCEGEDVVVSMGGESA